jgi:hypothetical protein
MNWGMSHNQQYSVTPICQCMVFVGLRLVVGGTMIAGTIILWKLAPYIQTGLGDNYGENYV